MWTISPSTNAVGPRLSAMEKDPKSGPYHSTSSPAKQPPPGYLFALSGAERSRRAFSTSPHAPSSDQWNHSASRLASLTSPVTGSDTHSQSGSNRMELPSKPSVTCLVTTQSKPPAATYAHPSMSYS